MNFVNMNNYIFRSIVLLISACCAGAAVDSTPVAVKPQTVVVIPVKGDVEPSMAAFIARSIRDTEAKYPAALIVLSLNTNGGRVDAALEIVDTMLTIPAARTVAFVDNKAYSAGALIALSCGRVYMRPNTAIGDCAPLMFTNDGPQMLGEKFQSPLRAKFRMLAGRNNYPPVLCESMVSDVVSIYQVTLPDTVIFIDSIGFSELPAARRASVLNKKTVLPRGKLLTMSDNEAVDLRFSQGSVSNIKEMLAKMNIASYTIINMEETWSETMARLIAKIAPLLMMIGFAALYIEFKTPGFGLPGILGIICIAVVFLAQFMAGLANYTELLLIILGIALIGIEIFVTPGLIIMGLSGAVAIAVGLLLSFQNFVFPTPSMPWQMNIFTSNIISVIGSMLSALVISILFLRFVFPKIGLLVQGPYLTETLKAAHSDSLEIQSIVVGMQGIALTVLRPSGKALIDQKQYDVVATGSYIEQGSNIKVIGITHSRIVVENYS